MNKGLKPLTQIGHAFKSARIKKQLDIIKACTKTIEGFGVAVFQSCRAFEECVKSMEAVKKKLRARDETI